MSSTPAEWKKINDELAQNLLAITETRNLLVDSAQGLRADLEARGWSPTAAESAACAWLIKAFSG